jgi:hypothetical protein
LKVIHDRPPFLDLPDSAFPLRCGGAAPVHRAGWRQQIGVSSRGVEYLDLRFKRLRMFVYDCNEWRRHQGSGCLKTPTK